MGAFQSSAISLSFLTSIVTDEDFRTAPCGSKSATGSRSLASFWEVRFLSCLDPALYFEQSKGLCFTVHGVELGFAFDPPPHAS